MTDEQLPLFEIATGPLSETEDIPPAPKHFISWDEVKEQMGWTPEQFAEADTETLSPVPDEDDEMAEGVARAWYNADPE